MGEENPQTPFDRMGSPMDFQLLVEQAKVALEKVKKDRRDLEAFIRLFHPLSIRAVESFAGWTIPKCAKQLILEAGRTLTTREILNGMLKRGWSTKSRRPFTVVHSGLNETPFMKRVGMKWDLSERGWDTEL